jgi:ATP-binding protein involved in chromosome partitioning
MELSPQQVLDRLRGVAFPGHSRDLVSLGVVRDVRADPARVAVELELGAADPALAGPLREAVRAAVAEIAGGREVSVHVRSRAAAEPALRLAGAARPSVAAAGGLQPDLIPEVRRVVAVASGKGGVGKSTVAVNLAVALARLRRSVGLLDADVYGPSVPLMMGVDDAPGITADRKLVPFERFGVRFMSLGFLVEREAAVIWRGPMVMKALQQLLGEVTWGALDYLVVDLPPGTGDAQLTIAQKVRLAGAIVVTTPQDVALADARKGVAMFRKVGVPILGIVENMSYFLCPHCSGRTEIFGHGGGRREAERLGVPCLGEVPLDPGIRRGGDEGRPLAPDSPDSSAGRVFDAIAERVVAGLEGSGGPPEGEPGPSPSIFDRFRRAIGGVKD